MGAPRQSRELGVTKSLFHARLEEGCRSLRDCTPAWPSGMTCVNMLPTSKASSWGHWRRGQLLEGSAGQSQAQVLPVDPRKSWGRAGGLLAVRASRPRSNFCSWLVRAWPPHHCPHHRPDSGCLPFSSGSLWPNAQLHSSPGVLQGAVQGGERGAELALAAHDQAAWLPADTADGTAIQGFPLGPPPPGWSWCCHWVDHLGALSARP